MVVFWPKIGQFWKFSKNLLEFDKTRRNTCLVRISAHLEHFWSFYGHFKTHFGSFSLIYKGEVIRQCMPYTCGSRRCDICLSEKLCILESDENCINKNTELMQKCRHSNKFKLKNIGKRKNVWSFLADWNSFGLTNHPHFLYSPALRFVCL